MRENLLEPRRLTWSLCFLAAIAGCLAWSAFPQLDSEPLLRIGIFAGLGFCMLGLIFFLPNLREKKSLQLIILTAVILRILLWAAPTSDDVHRYLWEGEIIADGGNPYSAVADDPIWENRRNSHWEKMNHRDRPTAYPPGIMWIMGATAFIAPTLLSFKALALLGDLLSLFLIVLLLKKHRAPPRWLGFYAFNPIVLISFAAEAHFDSLMIAAFLGAILLADRKPWLAWILLGVSIQVKLIALVLTPLFLTSKSWRTAWLLPVVLILPGLPFLSALPDWIAGVRTFAGESAFNAPLYSLLSFLEVNSQITRAICLLSFLVLATVISISRWCGASLLGSSLAMLAALLVCSPIVHFWYVAWLLPLIALRPSFAWTTLSITIAGYFLAWHTQDTFGWWGFGHGTALLIWLPWLIALLMQNRFFIQKSQAKKLSPVTFDLAIVIPVLKFNDGAKTLIDQLRAEVPPRTEIVVVESGDAPTETSNGILKISANLGRGSQIAAGFDATSAHWVLIAHADALPPTGIYQQMKQAAEATPRCSMIVCGQRFDQLGFGTLIVEALNEIRAVFGGVAFGDQAMLIRREAIDQASGFPTQPLMEDVEASLRLSCQGRVIYLGAEWMVSAQKWQIKFVRRFTMVFRLVASYQLARLRSKKHAAEVSKRMYAEYYPSQKP